MFAKKYSEVAVPPAILRDLQKVARLDFTVLYVYRDIFKITQQAGAQKIQLWSNRGVVRHVGSIRESGRRQPSNHYVIIDPILAKFLYPSINILDFVNTKVRKCPKCGTYNVRDWDTTPVQNCMNDQAEIDGGAAGKLGERTAKEAAAESA